VKPAKVTALESRRGPKQSRIPARAVTDGRLADMDRRVLGLLGIAAGRDGWCTRSQGRMAEELATAKRCVNRSIKKLAALGYVEASRQSDARGANRASRYRVVEPGGEDSGVPAPGDSGVAGDGDSGVPTPGTQESPAYESALTSDYERQLLEGTRSEKGSETDRRALTEPRSSRPAADSAKIEAAVALHRRICARLGRALDAEPGDLGEVLAWLEAGFDAERDVMAAIERVAKRRSFTPPLWLSYFRDAIAEEALKPGPGRPKVLARVEPTQREAAPEPSGPPQWLAIRARLRAELGEALFASWLAALEWRGVESGKLTLAAPTRFVANWVKRHYFDAVARAARAELGVEQVEIEHG
jgi:hypothetical protein